ncbi:hypothetical protein ACFPH6_45105 [Streptomyces xiangluensis]|uniref:Uncharacterized protein n=1 Tax=Streptomyces xiangluensis TaxID=2665720 RepID=A0ABV8Z5V3_9ACTN
MGFINNAKAFGAEFVESIKNAKVHGATDEARTAYAEGRAVLVYKIIEASGGSIDYTGPMTGVGEQIEAIEAEGWALANMATAESKTLSGDERVGLILRVPPPLTPHQPARPAPGPAAPIPRHGGTFPTSPTKELA